MKYSYIPLYREEIELVAQLDFPWEQLHKHTILITGATGMIGSFLTDVIMYKNRTTDLKCKIFAITRNQRFANERFSDYIGDSLFYFFPHDVNRPLSEIVVNQVDYLIHLASNTHPIQYALEPISTIETNIIGTSNLLKFATNNQVSRVVFASSVEIYGENQGNTELFSENDCGYINCNTPRAGYPEAKRCGEALCQAYIAQRGADIVIPRLTRTFGPTMKMDDSKAVSQFIKCALKKKNIVLKSEGKQYYSFMYVPDSVSGLLTAFFYGKKGEAYNIAEENHDCTLKEIAAIIADIAGTEIEYQLPNTVEASGYSKATKARLNGHKLMALGWKPYFDLRSGLERTIRILKS